MRHFLKALPLVMLGGLACGDNDETEGPRVTFESLGLEGVNIEELHVVGDRLFAVTRSGVFRRSLDAASTANWDQGAFAYTDAMVDLGGGELLLSEGLLTPTLQRSTDGGVTWRKVTEHFGSIDAERVRDFDRRGDTLFASGTGVVAQSTDGGRTWTQLYGAFDTFGSGLGEVHVDPRDGEIWAGGQGPIEDVVFVRSQDHGATWDEWPGIIGPPSTLTDIAFHPNDLQTLFAGFEEGLLRTRDDGVTWELVIDRHKDAKFFFGVEIDREVPSRVYAAGWLKRYEEPQQLILHISDDQGDSWTEVSGPATFGGVWDMVQIDRPRSEPAELLLGLQGGGVYRVRISR